MRTESLTLPVLRFWAGPARPTVLREPGSSLRPRRGVLVQDGSLQCGEGDVTLIRPLTSAPCTEQPARWADEATLVDPPRSFAPDDTPLAALQRRIERLARLLRELPSPSTATPSVLASVSLLALSIAVVTAGASTCFRMAEARARSEGVIAVPVSQPELACEALRALADGRREEALALYRTLDPEQTACSRTVSILEAE